MRALVTGGHGFIGTNLVERLLKDGADVVVFDSRPPRDPRTGRLPYRWEQGDLLDARRLADMVEASEPSHVFHLGARTDLRGSSEIDYRVNTDGTANLIDALTSLPHAPITAYASSRLVFAIDRPPRSEFDYSATTPYGRSKIAMEDLVRARAGEAGTWLVVRPTSIWGPHFEVPYRDFFDSVRSGRYVRGAGGTIHKSFGYVGNAVHELVTLAAAPAKEVNGRFFWLADYEPLELNEWSRDIARAFGVRPPLTVPTALLRAGARLGDVAKRLGMKEPPLTSFRLNNLQTEMVYDISATQTVVGALPFTTEEGTRDTVRWLEQTRRGSEAS